MTVAKLGTDCNRMIKDKYLIEKKTKTLYYENIHIQMQIKYM